MPSFTDQNGDSGPEIEGRLMNLTLPCPFLDPLLLGVVVAVPRFCLRVVWIR
jgi:hypothetical protein